MAGRTPSRRLSWSSGTISKLVPLWVKSMFLGAPLARRLHFDKDADRMMRRRSDVIAPVALLDGPMDLDPLKRPTNVDISLPQDHVLRRQISAPLSARRTLNAVARLDLLRQTPFQEQDVYWTLGPADVQGDQIVADQWVVRRSDINQWRKRLLNLGARVRRIHIEGLRDLPALADFSNDLARGAWVWQRVNAVLVTASVALAAVWWLYPGWIASQQTKKLTIEQADLQRQAIDLRRDVEALRQQERDRAAFVDLVYRRPQLSNMLRELSVALPDTVWIDTLMFRTGRLVITGESRGSAADLVLDLSDNDWFGNPRLTGQVSRTAGGAERFELTTEIGEARE